MEFIGHANAYVSQATHLQGFAKRIHLRQRRFVLDPRCNVLLFRFVVRGDRLDVGGMGLGFALHVYQNDEGNKYRTVYLP